MNETDGLPYAQLPAPPQSITSGALIGRMVAGLGFRLRWATEGLRADDYDFRPHVDGFSIGEVLEHIGQLVSWVHAQCSAGLRDVRSLPELPPGCLGTDRRAHCLRGLEALEQLFMGMDVDDLESIVIRHPRRGERGVWVLLNGPLADALTHVGQISAWRRQAGNPTPASDPFDGLPPPVTA